MRERKRTHLLTTTSTTPIHHQRLALRLKRKAKPASLTGLVHVFARAVFLRNERRRVTIVLQYHPAYARKMSIYSCVRSQQICMQKNTRFLFVDFYFASRQTKYPPVDKRKSNPLLDAHALATFSLLRLARANRFRMNYLSVYRISGHKILRVTFMPSIPNQTNVSTTLSVREANAMEHRAVVLSA